MRLGFIGLGQMGRAMAGRLIESGHELVVYNRTASVAEGFRGRARIAQRPQEAVDVEVVISMLADDAATDAIWSTMEPRGVHLNMATVSLPMARKLAGRHEHYVAAPVFGRPAVAAKGELDLIVAGSARALERCEPVFKALAKQVFVVGTEPEHANAVKIARNFLLATVIESLGEAFALVGRAGVDERKFLEIITSTSLAAPAYKNYGRMMVERAYEPAQFSMDLGLKDVELALATARENGLALPSAEVLRRNLRAAIASGRAHQDWVALAEFLSLTDNSPPRK